MKIAIDGRWLSRQPHGIARYCEQLIQHLPLRTDDQLVVLYNRADYTPPATTSHPHEILWWDLDLPLFSAAESWRMPQILKRLAPDLLHIPAYWKPYSCPCPWVMTLHDLIHLRPPVKLAYQVYYRVLHEQVKQAAGLLTVSQSSAERIENWSGRAATSIYPGVEAHFVPTQLSAEWLSSRGIRGPFLLSVSNPKAHKNTRLIEKLLQKSAAKWQWVSLGLPASRSPRHIALQTVSESELASLYTAASALLMPSLEEGLGLPLLESLACHSPVLASDIPVFREMLGPEYPLYSPTLDAASIQHWLTGIEQLLKTGKQPLLALAQPPQSSWHSLATETLEFYRQCA